MKIVSVDQIRALDAHTIQHEPISSIHLMERAALAFIRWYCAHFDNHNQIVVFCGQGNNGGDGLAIGRLLSAKGYDLAVYVVEHTASPSEDFQKNLHRIKNSLAVHSIQKRKDIPTLSPSTIIIDALLGSGLTRPVSGLLAEVVKSINQSPAKVISVDIASGLYANKSIEEEDTITRPDHTISFQLPKLAFMIPQNDPFVGDWQVVDIGLSREFIQQANTPYFFTDSSDAASLKRDREKFSHKGTYGHALLVAGSYGKMGAATLAGKACLRAGVGLLTMHVPRCGYTIAQISVPEAMASTDIHEQLISTLPDLAPYTAIGVGPGIGKDPQTLHALHELIENATVPMVWDADSLNLLSENKDLLRLLPKKTILTPHPKEFQRLAGNSRDDYERIELARDFAQKYQLILCLKGAHTAVIFADGTVRFNATGNAGMATGGSGDVLTGVITSFLAQGFSHETAALLGVFQHGAAGDRAAALRSQASLIASDIVDNLAI
jgi:NAD(P)H-hydrate epimerase